MWSFLFACHHPPEPALTVEPSEGAWPLVVSLSAEGTLGFEPLSYDWDLGDGATSEGMEIEHSYSSAGSYAVHLSVTDARGETRSATTTVSVTLPDCPLSGPPAAIGTVSDAELNELSGIAPSRRPKVPSDRYWVHEDSGNEPVLTALDGTGAVRSHHPILSAVDDAEDLAVVLDPETGISMIFLADTGDNAVDRENVTVMIFEEPDPDIDGDLQPVKELILVYPDGPHDSEALLVDPRTMDLYLVTKQLDGNSTVFRKHAPHKAVGPHILEQVATLPFTGGKLIGGAVTGGDISPDGSLIVLRTYLTTAYVWRRDGVATIAEALAGEPCPLSLAGEPQGEAISFGEEPGGASSLLTVSEGTAPKLFRVPLTAP